MEDSLEIPNNKVIGVCLGSQILAKVLGGEVKKGEKGVEVGFSKVQGINKTHPIFSLIESNEMLAFHLHEDTFTLPKGTEHLLSSSMYENQMFSYQNRAFALQCHLELTFPMLQVWQRVHKKYMEPLGYSLDFMREKQVQMEKDAKIIFNNIIQL